MPQIDLLFSYALVSAVVAACVAGVELLNRYSHAAKVGAIIGNWPALIFLTINFLAGMLAVYAASSSGVLDFHLDVDAWSAPNFFKALSAGAASLAILRSSFMSIGEDGDKGNLGPVAVLDAVKVILDRKIDLLQKIAMDKEIALIMANVDADKARHELPSLCLTGLNKCSEQDVQDMRDTISKLFSPETVHVRSLLIGHALYKFCGIEVLKSSVQVLGSKIQIGAPLLAKDEGFIDIGSLLNQELIRLKSSNL